MSVVHRWRRLQAARWVSVVLIGYVLWMSWQTLRVAFFGWLSSLAGLAVALVPGAFAVAGAVLAAAWRREREWAWFVLVVLAGLQVLSYGGVLLVGGPSAAAVVGTAMSVALILLALHPDSRSRIEQNPSPARPPSWRARR
jgi:hypothetical protein